MTFIILLSASFLLENLSPAILVSVMIGKKKDKKWVSANSLMNVYLLLK
jgi:hypothetical protein